MIAVSNVCWRSFGTLSRTSPALVVVNRCKDRQDGRIDHAIAAALLPIKRRR
jgi:hypothetical protein